MARTMSMREREYCYDHGWRIDDDGIIHLSRKDFDRYQYTSRSLCVPGIRMLGLPTDFGLCLIYEGKHFVIEEKEGK